jgi:hypothetical protein
MVVVPRWRYNENGTGTVESIMGKSKNNIASYY